MLIELQIQGDQSELWPPSGHTDNHD